MIKKGRFNLPFFIKTFLGFINIKIKNSIYEKQIYNKMQYK